MAVVSVPATTGRLGRLMQYSDILLALGVAMILGMMIIPLPEGVLDVLIVTNVSIAMVMLLRLGLNISASRLILLQGHAGEVIASFGNFVVGGNYVVGVVIFLILIVIQCVVITNGAGRVAEVPARFTLDSMPGKQMAIDADLNA